jgi:hypothetical protein
MLGPSAPTLGELAESMVARVVAAGGAMDRRRI